MVDYQYDITDFPNQVVNLESLQQEIDASISSQPVDFVNYEDAITTCFVFYDTALSGPDQTILDEVISRHTGQITPQQLIEDAGIIPLVQGRRTSTFADIPQTWTDLTFEATDITTDGSTLYHDTTNRDRFYVTQPGTYIFAYVIILDDEAETRVRINDTDVIPGSFGQYGNTGDAVDLNGNMPKIFAADLNAGDYVTVQVQANSGAENVFAESTFVIYKSQGSKGDTGAQGLPGIGSTIGVDNAGIPVSGSPFDILNFSDEFSIFADGSTANIALGGSGGATEGLCELIDTLGGQALNNTTPTPINWGFQDFFDSDIYSHTPGSDEITVLQAGIYEVSFNVNGQGGNNRSIPGIIVQTDETGSFQDVAKTLTACYVRNSANNDSTNTLPPATIELSINKKIRITAFRLGDSTGVSSKANASFVKIKYLGTA